MIYAYYVVSSSISKVSNMFVLCIKAGVDIANNVEEAKVNISVGTVLIEVGKDSTVDTQGTFKLFQIVIIGWHVEFVDYCLCRYYITF